MNQPKQPDPKSGTDELIRRLKAICVSDIMTRDVKTASPGTKLGELAAFISNARVSGLPVTDPEGKIIGMITATDLFNLMTLIMDGQAAEGGRTGLCNPSVKFAMSSEVVSVSPSATLYDVVGIMSKKKIHTLPVVENSAMVGIVGRHDVFKYFYRIINELDSSQSGPASA